MKAFQFIISKVNNGVGVFLMRKENGE